MHVIKLLNNYKSVCFSLFFLYNQRRTHYYNFVVTRRYDLTSVQERWPTLPFYCCFSNYLKATTPVSYFQKALSLQWVLAVL